MALRPEIMLIVTHEMRFAREVSGRVLFMDERYILQQGKPDIDPCSGGCSP